MWSQVFTFSAANLLLAAGFGSIIMLLWASAAAIPIVIHLLTRKRQVRVAWAAMQLLQQVVDQESRRVRFEQWLLLLLRCLILFVFGLALAAPFLSSLSNESANQRNTRLWIIAVDTSYSMGYRSAQVTRLQLAKDQIQELISNAQPGDAFALVKLSSPSRAVIRRPTFSRDKFLSELRTLQIRDLPADLMQGIAEVETILQDARDDPNIPKASHVVFVSDMGVDSWMQSSPASLGAIDSTPKSLAESPVESSSDSLAESTERSVLSKLRSLGTKTHFEFLSVAEPEPQNLAIVGIETQSDTTLVDQPLEIRVQLINTSANSAQSTLRISLDDKVVATREIQIPPSSTGSAPHVEMFTISPERHGDTVLSARLPADRLDVDNSRHQVISVRDEYSILFVEESPGDTWLIQTSLVPPELDSIPRQTFALDREAFDVRAAIELPTLDLTQWDIVYLHDLQFLDKNLLSQLANFARQGGRLVLSFGPHTSANVWNRLLEGSGLLGFRFRQESRSDLWTIDPLEYESPFVADFEGFPDSGLITMPLFRHWQIRDPQPELVEDLGIVGSTPLLVHRPLGRGKVVSLLSVPGPSAGEISSVNSSNSQSAQDWNAMATWPSFVPLMQQIFHNLLRSGQRSTNLRCGQVLEGQTSLKRASTITLKLPNDTQRVLQSRLTVEGSAYGWQYSPTDQHGIYVAKTDGMEESGQPFAVNLEPSESYLRSIDPADLPQSQPMIETQSGQDRPSGNEFRFSGLTKTLLGCVLLLLLTESFAAWWMGRRAG